MSAIFATLCQPLLFLRSHSFVTTAISTTSSHFHVTLNCMIQTRGRHFARSLKTINQQYQSAPLEVRGISFSLKRATASPYRNIRGFAFCSDTSKNLRFQLVANMSTRRSARLIAASESKVSSSTMAPPPPPAPAQKGRKRKAVADPAPNGVTEDAPAKAPTASKKRRTQRPSTPPPPSSTPTPSNVKLMAEPAAPGDAVLATPPSKKPRAAAVDRLADSNTTLATLLSPETSRVVTSKKARTRSPSGSPTKQPVQKTPATASILEEANRFLVSVDPRMRPLVENHHCRIFSPEGLAEEIDPFESLCSGIISQQVSGAAAKSIKNKFIGLFHEIPDGEESAAAGGDGNEEQAKERRFPHPSEVVKVPLEKLRTAGLSQRKAEYVSGLAEKFVNGELSAQILADAPYEEVISRLTAVRGLGLWSAEMFACFGLKRIDVFSLGDLGVQRGMAAFVGRDIAKLKSKGGKFKYMSEADMTALSEKFKPYRSLFMWYMWRVEETDVSTME
ncbi:HhH-GPD superfamily base excision DNA repair protein [Xylaria flabelliformis]|nr:HhH-GPD superfamily base excision DNA repair protein [Xylaria flabelliformis]